MPWHPSFSIHLPDLDAQHQYFVNLLDKLDIACQVDDDARIALVLAELQRYARYHFTSEETLMAAYDYPSDGQRNEHRKLLARLDDMLHDPTFSRAKIRLFVYKWLTNHIQLDDREFAKHVLECRKPFLEPLEAKHTDGGDEPQLRITATDDD